MLVYLKCTHPSCYCLHILIGFFWERNEWLNNPALYFLFVYGVEVPGGYLETLLYD